LDNVDILHGGQRGWENILDRISKNVKIKVCARGKNAGAQFIAPNQVKEYFVAGA
jgi:hypothetical protein